MLKLKRILCGALLPVIFSLGMLFLVACGNDEPGKSEAVQPENSKPQIGMSFDSFVIERWQKDRDIFVSMAKELGAEVNVQNANGDIDEQKKQIEYFIDKGMDAIVIICIDSDSLADTVKKAKNAGIKVVAYDRLIHNADVDLYVSFDNYEVGSLMGNGLIDNGITEKNVVILGGAPADDNVPQVEAGFTQVMNDNGNTILDSMHAEGWRAELAGDYVYNHLDVIEQADAIMCGNDNLATAVVHALSENRMLGAKLVVGQDADLEACQRIVEGTQVMTVYKPVEKLAGRAAEYTMKLINNEEITGEDVVTANDGTNDVPYLKLDPIAVNKDNINEVIINSGFHLKEDVYLNVPAKMPK